MKKINIYFILNFFICILFLALPYYLFSGKMFIGGDDTRLFYAYPLEFFKNVSFFSWNNVSSIGTNVTNQYLLPFLYVWFLLSKIIVNTIVLSYFAFSLPLILGFLFFQKFIKELFQLNDSSNPEILIGSLFYILSPIIIINQLFVFPIAVWLLFIIPALGYLYLRYLNTSNYKYIFISVIVSFFFAFALYAMPWLFGFLLPMSLGVLVMVIFYSKKEILGFIKKSVIYFVWIAFTQAFWIVGFVAPYFSREENSTSLKFVSGVFTNTFAPTVISTATSYIIYPLLNLFHRQIAFDFQWMLKGDFIRLYDKTFILNSIFIFVLGTGIFSYKKYLDKNNKRKFLLIFLSFLLSIYFFTVNIGPLEYLFLFLGRLPGFVMFRNFYDKFAPGYVILYAILLTISLVLFKKKYPKIHRKILLLLLLVMVINFSSVKSTVNSPLWTTQNIYKTITIPQEYYDFMNLIKSTISSTNTILSIPFGTAAYTVIKDERLNNVYVGTSPVKIFSGVNDISGSLSFNLTKEADIFNSFIEERKYDGIKKILHDHSINYVLVTKNIPSQVLQSWIFDKDSLEMQDSTFLNEITDKRILTSSNGNYELYSTRKPNSLLETQNLFYKKINSVKYIVQIRNISVTQPFNFNDSYHVGWKLFIQKNQTTPLCSSSTIVGDSIRECKEEPKLFDVNEMSYLWQKSIFDSSHKSNHAHTNTWMIDLDFIKKNYGPDYYTVNHDGSINTQFVLYYTPQLYFYFGTIMSLITIILSSLYLIMNKYRSAKI